MILGVTGTIGSGKSTVCRILKEKGFPVVSADEIGHRILEFPQIKEKICENFGNVTDDEGKIDRKKLADLVFDNPEKVKLLNSLTHPIIRETIKKETKELEKQNKIVVCEIPLLFECGFEDLVDKILLVYVSDEKTIERLLGRGMTENEALKRLKNQQNYKKKLEKSDFFISNEENFEKLAFKVAEVIKKC